MCIILFLCFSDKYYTQNKSFSFPTNYPQYIDLITFYFIFDKYHGENQYYLEKKWCTHLTSYRMFPFACAFFLGGHVSYFTMRESRRGCCHFKHCKQYISSLFIYRPLPPPPPPPLLWTVDQNLIPPHALLPHTTITSPYNIFALNGTLLRLYITAA